MIANELYKKLQTFRYGTFDLEENYVVNLNTRKLYDNLKTLRFLYPDEIEENKMGICFDFSLYIYKYLKDKDIKYLNPFYYNIKNERFNIFHLGVIFKEDEKFIWVENTWNDFKGINYFQKEEQAFDSIKQKIKINITIKDHLDFETILKSKDTIKNYDDFLNFVQKN